MSDIPKKFKITANMSTTDVIVLMSQGNPGALNVMSSMVRRAGESLDKQAEAFMRILDLDDMGIHGDMIWIGFKDFAGQDLDVLEAALRSRDQKLVDAINNAMKRDPRRTDRAVTSGASF